MKVAKRLKKIFVILNVYVVRFCSLENEPEETHPMNQSILYNHGLFIRPQIYIHTQSTSCEPQNLNREIINYRCNLWLPCPIIDFLFVFL